jgi:hypothetical protein
MELIDLDVELGPIQCGPNGAIVARLCRSDDGRRYVRLIFRLYNADKGWFIIQERALGPTADLLREAAERLRETG